MLRPLERRALLLFDVVRDSGETDSRDLRHNEGRLGVVSQHLLQRYLHENQSHIEDLQQGREEHQEASLHFAYIAGGYSTR